MLETFCAEAADTYALRSADPEEDHVCVVEGHATLTGLCGVAYDSSLGHVGRTQLVCAFVDVPPLSSQPGRYVRKYWR